MIKQREFITLVCECFSYFYLCYIYLTLVVFRPLPLRAIIPTRSYPALIMENVILIA